MAFDGVPIGISDALPRNRRFWRGRARVSGSPVLEHWLVIAAFPASGLLILLYCCFTVGLVGALPLSIFPSFSAPVCKPIPARVCRGRRRETVCFPQAKLLYLLKLTGYRFQTVSQ